MPSNKFDVCYGKHAKACCRGVALCRFGVITFIWFGRQKNRQTLINETVEPYLYAQLVSKASEMGCHVYAINGMPDHVHIVLAISPKHSVAEIVKLLKGASSHFVNQILRPVEFTFQWQRGYGCFTLGQSQLPRAVAYVESQKEHHALKTTNIWLEKSSEEDEGPQETDTTPQVTNILRESPAEYDVQDEMPF